MPSIERILAAIPLFAGLDEAQIERIKGICNIITCPPDMTLIREGERGDAMYVLTKGRVHVTRTVTLSLSKMTVATGEKSFVELHGTDYPSFGEMALLENSLRGATVTALIDCELLEISHDGFERLCLEDPSLGYKVTRNMATQLSGRLRTANQDVLKLSTALSLALSRRQQTS